MLRKIVLYGVVLAEKSSENRVEAGPLSNSRFEVRTLALNFT